MTTGNNEHANIHLVTSAFHSFNEKNWDAITRVMADDFAINIAGMPYQRQGVDAWRENIDIVHAGFPDIQAEVEDVFGSGDKVVVRLTMSGTHSGEFMGIGPTGRGWNTSRSRFTGSPAGCWPRSGSARTWRR